VSRTLPGGDDLVSEAVTRSTGYLLKVAEIGADGVPGWLVPPEFYSVPSFRIDFPDGGPACCSPLIGVLSPEAGWDDMIFLTTLG
jgi:hypothetical protein